MPFDWREADSSLKTRDMSTGEDIASLLNDRRRLVASSRNSILTSRFGDITRRWGDRDRLWLSTSSPDTTKGSLSVSDPFRLRVSASVSGMVCEINCKCCPLGSGKIVPKGPKVYSGRHTFYFDPAETLRICRLR